MSAHAGGQQHGDRQTARPLLRRPEIRAFFDEGKRTVTYVVSDPTNHHGVITEWVLDFDPASGWARTASADRILD